MVLGTPDALEGLLLNVVQPATPSLLRNCVWALSNMCRGKPQPDMALLAPALPVLLKLLSSDDSEVQLSAVTLGITCPLGADLQKLNLSIAERAEAPKTVVFNSTDSSRAFQKRIVGCKHLSCRGVVEP